MHVIVDPSPAIDHLNPVPDKGQDQADEKPLPRFIRPEWVIVYITAIYAFIAGLTLVVVKKQLLQMTEQNAATRNSAEAAWENAKTANAQIQWIKSKERARLEITRGRLEVQDEDGQQWCLIGDINISNHGASPASILRSGGEFVIQYDAIPLSAMRDQELGGLLLPYRVVNPSKETMREGFWSEYIPYAMDDFAYMLTDVQAILCVRGFIEYETLGSKWRRDFAYIWVTDSNFERSRKLSLGSVVPPNAIEQIQDGSWEEDPDQKNGEYEIPQNPN